MTIRMIEKRLPNVMNVLGEAWLDKQRAWILQFINSRIKWYEQTEADLTLLRMRVDSGRMTSCYRKMLRDRPQTQKCIYEIHGAALLSAVADRVDIHFPRSTGSQTNFDVRAKIGSSPNFPVKA
jgi:hypothetical protein